MNFTEAIGVCPSTHKTYDFVDVHIDMDNRLYLYAPNIEYSDCEFASYARHSIQTFFTALFTACKKRDFSRMRKLLSHGGEINEIHLGLSAGESRGRGSSVDILFPIFKKMIDDGFFDDGINLRPSDIRIFAENFDMDRMSDLIANVIRHDLWHFTAQQSFRLGLSMENEALCQGYIWNSDSFEWELHRWPGLLINGQPITLVPKSFVTNSARDGVSKYLSSCVLTFRQEMHLRDESHLCQRVTKKDGTIEVRKPFKKDIRHTEITDGTKRYVGDITRGNPHILERYHRNFTSCNASFLSDAQLDRILHRRDREAS